MRLWLAIIGASAGGLGAAGVALAAYGAHRSGDPSVTTAAYFLLFHAAALVGLVGAMRARVDRMTLAAASVLALGVVLFSGDLALRAIAHIAPIRMAAPTGGVLMIVGWLLTAVALPISLRRG